MAMSPGFGLKILSVPTWQPVLATDMQGHARVYGNTDITNGVMAGYVSAAQAYVENQTGLKFGSQQWLLTCDEFPGRQVDDYRPPTWRYGIFRLPYAPLISVDMVQYVDPGVAGGQPFALTTLNPSMYQYDTYTQPGRLAPSPFNVWPATNPLAVQAVQITFTCGVTSTTVQPDQVQAIKMVAAHFYDNRSATRKDAIRTIPLGIRAMVHNCSVEEYD